MKKKLLPDLHVFNLDKKTETEAVGTDFIYVIGSDGGMVKIGTTNDLWVRFEKLRGMSPKPLEPLMFWVCRNGRSVEAALHALFRDYRRHGEWFYFGDHSSRYNVWKYRHLASSALLTCTHPPVPVHGSVLHDIQYQHVPDDDPVWDEPGVVICRAASATRLSCSPASTTSRATSTGWLIGQGRCECGTASPPKEVCYPYVRQHPRRPPLRCPRTY